MPKLSKYIFSIIACEGVGIIAGFFTIPAVQTWYKTLNKPEFSPPNWVFGPVWTLLYLMMGISASLVWIKGLRSKNVRIALTFFTIQLALNFLWSILFFGLHSPILAMVDIIFLWLAIFMTILRFYKISKAAAYLMIPYLLWVSFASVLNSSIVILNP